MLTVCSFRVSLSIIVKQASRQIVVNRVKIVLISGLKKVQTISSGHEHTADSLILACEKFLLAPRRWGSEERGEGGCFHGLNICGVYF